ncbi:hypothetical protein [Burkholderia gladioli]|uniref:hypothetical protein n=2 Tax=Burkholderia gladioli TaxID=28095 RepID=UPI0016408061|nr:hypothetical protein [Burkholderia gladioli]
MKYPLIVASSIVAADILVWRARLPPYERTRLFIRLALFAALSWLLFSADMSPFGEPPYRDAAGLHWLGKLTAALPAEQEHGHSLFDWLFGKMRHVHSLHD